LSRQGERFRPADIGIAGLEKPALALDFPRDPDARARADRPDAPRRGAEPQNFARTKIDSAIALVDVHGLGEAAGATRNVAAARRLAHAPHDLDAFEGLERTQEHTGTDARLFARDVHHEGGAVGKIDVAIAGTEKQSLVASGLAAEGVAR